MIAPAHPTTDDLLRQTDDLIPWARRWLRKKYGNRADDPELARQALDMAAVSFDPAKGVPYRGWCARKLLYEGRSFMRELDGRCGTKKHEANRGRCQIEDWDAPTVSEDSRAVSVDVLIERLQLIDGIQDELGQLVALGLVNQIPRADLSRILGRNKKDFVNRTLAAIRESVAPH